MLGGQKAKGTFKIMKQKSKNEKVGLKIGLVKFHKEFKHEGDTDAINSQDQEKEQ